VKIRAIAAAIHLGYRHHQTFAKGFIHGIIAHGGAYITAMCVHEFEISEGASQRWVSAFEKFFLHYHLWITLDCNRESGNQNKNEKKHRNILVTESMHCRGMEYQVIHPRAAVDPPLHKLIHVLSKK
jgi:hypothetical protein